MLGALFGLLLLAGLAAIIARREVVAMWPATARIYAVAGLSAALFGSGLELAKIAPTRTTDGLVIEGDITNTGTTARDVPRLRVALWIRARRKSSSRSSILRSSAGAGGDCAFQDIVRPSRRSCVRGRRDVRPALS